jgi:hypothetical protein
LKQQLRLYLKRRFLYKKHFANNSYQLRRNFIKLPDALWLTYQLPDREMRPQVGLPSVQFDQATQRLLLLIHQRPLSERLNADPANEPFCFAMKAIF